MRETIAAPTNGDVLPRRLAGGGWSPPQSCRGLGLVHRAQLSRKSMDKQAPIVTVLYCKSIL